MTGNSSVPNTARTLMVTVRSETQSIIALFSTQSTPTATPKPDPSTPTPAPTPQPTNTSVPPTATPKQPTPTPQVPSTNTPLAGTGNIAFQGSSGWVYGPTTVFGLVRRYLRNGLVSVRVSPGKALNVEVAASDEYGKRLSHVLCKLKFNLLTHFTRNSTFTLYAPTHPNDQWLCNIFYGSEGGYTVRIAGAPFRGAPVTSLPTNEISWNGTTHFKDRTTVRLGEPLTLLWPQSVTQLDSNNSLQFCNFYCHSENGLETWAGQKGAMTQHFTTVSTNWVCTANYSPSRCY